MYIASLLNPLGKTGGTATAEIDGFEFIGTDGTKRVLPYSSCEIEFGGTGNRFIYVSISAEETLVIENPAILKESNVQYSRLAEKVNAITAKGNNRTARRWIVSLFAVVGLVATSAGIISFARTKIPNYIPRSVDYSLGGKLLPLVMKKDDVISDDQSQKLLAELQKRLVTANHLDSFPFKLTLINNDIPNAFALPSGDLVIHSGLIEESASVDELAGVLAHEMGHVTARHHLRGAVDRVGFLIIVRILVGLDGPADILKKTKDLSLLTYSRSFEREADSLGVAYMKSAGFSPNQFAGFFTRLASKEKIALPEFFSTHPDPKERSERVKRLGGVAIQPCKNFPIEYTAYRNHLKSILSKEKER